MAGWAGKVGQAWEAGHAGQAGHVGQAARATSAIEKDKKMHTAASTQELPENQQKCPGAHESEKASKC